MKFYFISGDYFYVMRLRAKCQECIFAVLLGEAAPQVPL